MAENFFSHLKTEFYHQFSFPTRLVAHTEVMEYIEAWYNRARPNARAGGFTPAAALAAYQASGQKLWPRNQEITSTNLSQKLDERSPSWVHSAVAAGGLATGGVPLKNHCGLSNPPGSPQKYATMSRI